MSDDFKLVRKRDTRPRSAKITSAVIEGLVILMALVLAYVVRTSWLETAIVVSGSMKPTLQVGARVLVDHRASLAGQWQRGDIVIFDNPPLWKPGTYIKRIIAVPGDVIHIIDGRVFINGQKLAEPYLAQRPLPETYGPWKMGPGYYFMMGDNRNNSEDSRDDGPVLGKYIRGHAIFQLWPLADIGSLH